MATLVQRQELAEDATFKKQIEQQILIKAGSVLISSVSSYKSIDAYKKSIDMANRIIASSTSYVDSFAKSAAANGTFAGIATPIATDAEVVTIVGIIFPYMAGLTISDI
jgi:hypothetical protein